jgi:hypothetical protein
LIKARSPPSISELARSLEACLADKEQVKKFAIMSAMLTQIVPWVSIVNGLHNFGDSRMSRITEAEIADIVEAILSERPNGEATIAELVDEIPNRVTLSAEDLAPSPTRNGETLWEQQVRNITSHKASPGNAIHDGRLTSIAGGLKLARKASAA